MTTSPREPLPVLVPDTQDGMHVDTYHTKLSRLLVDILHSNPGGQSVDKNNILVTFINPKFPFQIVYLGQRLERENIYVQDDGYLIYKRGINLVH